MFIPRFIIGGIFSFLVFSLFLSSAFAEIPQNIPLDQNQAEQWIHTEKPFTAIAFKTSELVEIFVKTPTSNWIPVLPDGENETPEFDSSDSFFTELIFFEKPETQFQFQIKNSSQTSLSPILLSASVFSGERTPSQKVATTGTVTIPKNTYTRDMTFFKSLNIITREEWGADESYRIGKNSDSGNTDEEGKTTKEKECAKLQKKYPDEFLVQRTQSTEDGESLRWPFEYSKSIEKVIIHHTASTLKENQTPESAIRSIYSYHANSRKWGDIGYNFIITPNGNIYEGRAGGDYTVGGHAYCVNINTIGIALLGNFQEETVSLPQQASLKKLLIGLSEKYQIDLSASSYFHGETTQNLLGHRDVGSTSCPGDHLYSELPSIKKMLSSLPSLEFLRSIIRSAEFIGKITVAHLQPKGTYTFALSYKNTGNIPWKKDDTWLYAVLPDSDIRTIPPTEKPSFVASLLRESQVSPGEIGNFDVTIEAGNEGGLHTFEFIPVIRQQKIAMASIIFPIETESAQYVASLEDFSSRMDTAQDLFLSFSLKNTGNAVWKKEDVQLEIEINLKKYLFSLSQDVPSQTSGIFSGTLHFEKNPKSKNIIRVHLLKNGKSILEKPILQKSISTNFTPIIKANILNSLQNKILVTHFKNTIFTNVVSVRNDGNTIWEQNNTTLSLRGPVAQKIVKMQQIAVKPGEIATFALESKNKISKNTTLRFDLKMKNKKISGGQGIISIFISTDPVLNHVSPTPTPSISPSPSPSVTPEITKGIDEQMIRIKLGYKDTQATISGNGSASLDGKIISFTAGSTVSKEGDFVKIGSSIGKVFRLTPASGDILTINSWERRPSWDTSLNDNEFRGTVEIRVYNGEFIIINELPMVDYLNGIAEVSNSAPVEKQKVIAVVARTYSAFYLHENNRKYPGAPYDGDDSPNSFQKYLGYGYEKRAKNFSKAVEATKNMVVTYNGELIKTPFFSESNGRTKSAKDVWGWENTPYLVSVSDVFCKNGKGTQSGHGVGLSGCGAEEMAKQGKTFIEILEYYYTGITVEKR